MILNAGGSVYVQLKALIVLQVDPVQVGLCLSRLCSAALGQHLQLHDTCARKGTSAAAAAAVFMLLPWSAIC